MASTQIAFEVVRGETPDPFINETPCWQHTEEFLLGSAQYAKETHEL